MSLNFLFLNIYPLLNEIFLLIVVCFCLVFGAIFSNFQKFYFPILSKSIYFFCLLSLCFSFILLLNASPIFFLFLNDFLISDSLVFYSKFLLIFFTIMWFLMFNSFLNFEFWILILLSLLALSLLLHSCDLLSIYLTLEFLSLIFYVLTSIIRTSEFSVESGLKYFILGAFASAFLLFGFALIYNFTGLTNLSDLSIFFAGYFPETYSTSLTLGISLSIFCIFTSLLFKLGAAPFHFWLPDVYEGAPTSVTAWFALLPKLVILSLLIRFIYFTFGDFNFFYLIFYLVFCTFCSSIVGTFGAFSQDKWKRFIAFSSISHLSFFLLNFCVLKPIYLTSLLFYLIIYLFMTSSFFSFFNNFNHLLFPILYSPRFFNSLNSLSISNPLLSLLFSITLFSFAGIPPLAGFFIKFFVLFSGISGFLYFLVVFMLILNCIACFYYINLIKKIYFENSKFKYLPVITINPFKNFWNPILISFFSFIIILVSFDFEFFFLFSDLLCSSFIF